MKKSELHDRIARLEAEVRLLRAELASVRSSYPIQVQPIPPYQTVWCESPRGTVTINKVEMGDASADPVAYGRQLAFTLANAGLS